LIERAQIAKQKDNDLSFSTFAAISALRKLVRATKTVAALFFFYLFCIEI
jgi:replication-associated recombination protein RarA